MGKVPVPGRPLNSNNSRARPTALAVGAGGIVWTFFSCLSFLCSFSLSLETARYRLKYCLKGPLDPKQPTNHLPYLCLMGSSVMIYWMGP